MISRAALPTGASCYLLPPQESLAAIVSPAIFRRRATLQAPLPRRHLHEIHLRNLSSGSTSSRRRTSTAHCTSALPRRAGAGCSTSRAPLTQMGRSAHSRSGSSNAAAAALALVATARTQSPLRLRPRAPRPAACTVRGAPSHLARSSRVAEMPTNRSSLLFSPFARNLALTSRCSTPPGPMRCSPPATTPQKAEGAATGGQSPFEVLVGGRTFFDPPNPAS
jgi:hypothetical protein